MTEMKGIARHSEVKGLLEEDRDLLQEMIHVAVQEFLEAEMTEALGAAKGERTEGRLGYRSGYYSRSLVTQIEWQRGSGLESSVC